MRFAVVLCLVGAGAQAACVTGADMERGVRVAFSDGTGAVLRSVGAGMVEVDEALTYEPGAVMRSRLAQGLWELEIFDVGADGRRLAGGAMRWMYPVKPEALPVPVAGLRWKGWATPEMEGGPVLRSDELDIRVAEAEPLVVGTCDYPALAVAIRVERATEGRVDLELRYLPELGVALRLGREADGEPPERREVVALEALP
jgi:hypothetical protein